LFLKSCSGSDINATILLFIIVSSEKAYSAAIFVVATVDILCVYVFPLLLRVYIEISFIDVILYI